MITWFQGYFMSPIYAKDISNQRCNTNRETPCMMCDYEAVKLTFDPQAQIQFSDWRSYKRLQLYERNAPKICSN